MTANPFIDQLHKLQSLANQNEIAYTDPVKLLEDHIKQRCVDAASNGESAVEDRNLPTTSQQVLNHVCHQLGIKYYLHSEIDGGKQVTVATFWW